MKLNFIFYFLGTIFIGWLAGYGVTNLGKIVIAQMSPIQYLASDSNLAAVKEISFEKEAGGPTASDFKNKDTSKENPDSLNREINYTTKKNGFNIINSDKKFPQLTTPTFLIGNLETGEIFKANQEENSLPIASLSKFMTALTVFQNISEDELVTISRSAVGTYGRQGNLVIGEKIKSKNLLRALLLESSNDAAEAFAEHLDRDLFLKKMNEEAKKLNLKKTFFDDPSGLSFKNVSSAKDLFLLTQQIFKKFPEIIEITQEKSYQSPGHLWYSNSRFKNDSNYFGGKNGYTDEAQGTLISIFNLPIGENESLSKIVIIILGSQNSERDMRKVLSYLLSSVEYVK